jgi:hypothetical protein
VARSTFGQLNHKLGRFERELIPAEQIKMLKLLGRWGKRDYEKFLKQDLGADQKMSNWWNPKYGGKPAKVQVRYKVKARALGADNLTFAPKPVGLFYVVDQGRVPKQDSSPLRKDPTKSRKNSPSRGHNTAERAKPVVEAETLRRLESIITKKLAKSMRRPGG